MQNDVRRASQNMQKKGPVMRISPFTGPDYFLKATPHNESCGALRKFCALTLLRFHGNTSSITAKLCLVSTQNLLANHSCSIIRYCLRNILSCCCLFQHYLRDGTEEYSNQQYTCIKQCRISHSQPPYPLRRIV